MRRLVVLLAVPLVALAACGTEPQVRVSAVGAAAAATSRAETARFTIDVTSGFGDAKGSFVGRLDGTEADGTFEVFGKDVTVKVVDGTVYAKVPFLPASRPWVGLSPDGLGPAGGGQRSVTDALDATATTHYVATVDAEKVRRALPGGAGGLGGSTVPVDVWVDADGLVRRVHVSAGAAGGRGGMEAQLDITDLGVPVDVTAPPADQVLQLG
jgi:hypothetical protein